VSPEGEVNGTTSFHRNWKNTQAPYNKEEADEYKKKVTTIQSEQARRWGSQTDVGMIQGLETTHVRANRSTVTHQRR